MQIINRKIPREGNSSTLIDRLNAYIQPVDNEWGSKIKPADIKSINKLERVLGMERVGINFPQSFVEFVKYAGEDDGGLISKVLIGKFSITNMIKEIEEEIIQEKKWDMWKNEVYITEKEMLIPEEEMFLSEIDSLAPYYFEFFMNEMGISYSMMIQDNVEKGIYEEEVLICDSFEKLLFQSAVRLYEKEYFLINLSFGASASSLKESLDIRKGIKPFELLDELCTKYSLTKAWFSDKHFLFVYSKETSIYLRETVGISGMIVGNDEKLIKAIANDLLPKIGAR